jgi:hypothetical protein
VKQRAPYLLAALVATSFVARTAVGWLRSVPALFPDEYIYSSIGRSIAESPAADRHRARLAGR